MEAYNTSVRIKFIGITQYMCSLSFELFAEKVTKLIDVKDVCHVPS